MSNRAAKATIHETEPISAESTHWADYLPPRPLAVPALPPDRVIHDDSRVDLSFNVMPDRNVSETLHVREYRVWPSYAEASFDRTYASAMAASPSHLIFLTGLAHTQKLVYILMAHRLGLEYTPGGPELGKFWVTDVRIHIPRMIRQDENLIQRLWIVDATPTSKTAWSVEICTSFCDSMTFWARSPFFLL